MESVVGFPHLGWETWEKDDVFIFAAELHLLIVYCMGGQRRSPINTRLD
jgi:hypothetical protein